MPIESVRIKGSRIVLDNFQAEDALPLARYRHHPEVARYQSWVDFSLDQAMQLIDSMRASEPWKLDVWFQLALRLSGSQQLIGDIGIRRRTNGPAYDAEIGYSLDPQFQKQGFMREGLSVFMAWASRQLHIRRFIATIDPRNEASARLLLNLGFQREARLRQSIWFKGAWADEDVYVLRIAELEKDQ